MAEKTYQTEMYCPSCNKYIVGKFQLDGRDSCNNCGMTLQITNPVDDRRVKKALAQAEGE